MCNLAGLLETLEIVNKPLKGSCVYVCVYNFMELGLSIYLYNPSPQHHQARDLKD